MLVYPSGGGGGISNYDLIADGVYSVSDVARVNTEAELTSAIAGAKHTILVDGDITLSGNHTVTQHLIIRNGAVITLDSNTLTISGPFTAGRYQVFSGAGVEFDDDSSINDVYPEWWGAVTNDDSVSCEIAIQLAINSLSGRTATWKGTVSLACGTYWCLDKISGETDSEVSMIVPKDGVSIIGQLGTTLKAADGLNDTYEAINFICLHGILQNAVFANFTIDWNGANNLLEAGDAKRSNAAIMTTDGGINILCEKIIVRNNPGDTDIAFGQRTLASQGNICVKDCQFFEVGSGLSSNYNVDHTSIYLCGDGLKIINCYFESTGLVEGAMMECHGSRFEAYGNTGLNYVLGIWFVTNVADGYDVSFHHNHLRDIYQAFSFSLTATFQIDDVRIHDNVFRMHADGDEAYFAVISDVNYVATIERVSVYNNSFYGVRNDNHVRCFGVDLAKHVEICNNKIYNFKGHGIYTVGNIIADNYIAYKLVFDGNEFSAVGIVGHDNAVCYFHGGASQKIQVFSANNNQNCVAGGNVFIYINAAIENGVARGNLVPADGTMAYPLFPDTTAGKIYIEHCGPFSAPAGIACATGSKWLDTSADTSKAWNGSAWA